MTISIPDAREQLIKWADEWDKPELKALAAQMVRRSPKYPRARKTRQSLTCETADKIREYKAANPLASNRAIGEKFNVDGGRVSEAIHKSKGI